MDIRFRCTHKGAYDEHITGILCEALSVSQLTAHALIRCGISDPSDAREFLHPELQPLHDPFLLPNMEQAIKTIQTTIADAGRICVYGDYDADGICATAILLDCLCEAGAEATAYIPLRQREGYGLNTTAIDRLSNDNVKLIITVDTGISAPEEVQYAQSLGIEVIVTDHHSLSGPVPECAAVVSALLPNASYPNKVLCGAGLSMQLCRALSEDGRLTRWLPLAALATIADIVPLLGENRIIAARGIPMLDDIPGLNALLRIAGNNGREIDETTVSFMLAPRLNAAGRLGDAMRAVRLLCTRDASEAGAIAQELDDENMRRKQIEATIFDQAALQIASEAGDTSRAILLRGKNWNTGVIGIVASRLCEMKNRPVILFSEDDSGILTGSGRSIIGVDLHEALCRCKQYFIRFGGHSGAAGITMNAAQFPNFCADFCAYLAAAYSEDTFIPTNWYDEAVGLKELTLSTASQLRMLAPFGEGNQEPVYCINDLMLSEIRRIGRDGRHLSMRACAETASLRAVAFGLGDRESELAQGKRWSVLSRAVVNSYRGNESVEMQLLDAQPYEKVFNAFFIDILYNGIGVEDFGFIRRIRGESGFPDQNMMRQAYAAFRGQLEPSGITPQSMTERYPVDMCCAMLVFCELSFFSLDRVKGVITRSADVQTRKLEESVLYRIWSMKD